MITMRFDMRAATAEHYAAALDMAAWGEDHGVTAVVVSEHHGSEDGYLPSPLVLASAMAARTSRIAIQVGALILPLHDPVELAEQMAVLDLVSNGRVSYICAVGYRASEYWMFGQQVSTRGRRLEESIAVLRQAWTGEPFNYQGRPCRVTPVPVSPGGPFLMLGGGSPAAVRRAARLGMGMVTERNAGLHEIYRGECERLGVDQGFFVEVPADSVTSAFVAADPDALWDQIGPHVLHDARAYRRWVVEGGGPTPVSVTEDDSVAAIRAAGRPYRVFTPAEARDLLAAGGSLALHPLCGGLPVDIAWSSLHTLADEVLPAT